MSVVIPAFNAADVIVGAVASAAAQDIDDLEILVVDDASTDATAATVRDLADPRVRLLRLAVNGGPAAARNAALDAATGEWIAPLDADDRFGPDRLERLLALADETRADMVADNLMLRVEVGPPVPMIPPDRLPAPRPLGLAEFVALNEGGIDRSLRTRPRFSLGFLKPMIRRDFLDRHGLRYDPRNRYAEDYMFAARCLAAGARWWLAPEATYHYAVRDGSATDVQSADDLARIVAFDRALLADQSLAADPELRRALTRHLRSVERRHHYRRFADAVKAGRFAEAGALFLESATSMADVLRLAAWNTPLVVAKALAGGYGRGAGS